MHVRAASFSARLVTRIWEGSRLSLKRSRAASHSLGLWVLRTDKTLYLVRYGVLIADVTILRSAILTVIEAVGIRNFSGNIAAGTTVRMSRTVKVVMVILPNSESWFR